MGVGGTPPREVDIALPHLLPLPDAKGFARLRVATGIKIDKSPLYVPPYLNPISSSPPSSFTPPFTPVPPHRTEACLIGTLLHTPHTR